MYDKYFFMPMPESQLPASINTQKFSVLSRRIGIRKLVALTETKQFIHKQAVLYVDDQFTRRGIQPYEQKKQMERNIERGLKKSYIKRENTGKLKLYWQQWGEGNETEFFSNTLQYIRRREKEVVDEEKQLRGKEAWRIGKAIWKTGREIPKLSVQEKKQFFEMIGYHPEEINQVIKKLGISSALTTTTSAASFAVIAGASGLAAFQPFLHNLDWKAVILSYGFNYGMLGINIYKNIQLLKDKRINNCDNAPAASMYYLCDKILPQSKRWARFTKYAITASVESVPGIMVQDVPIFIASLFPGIALITTTRNVTDGLLNLSKALIKQKILKDPRVLEDAKKNLNKTQESLKSLFSKTKKMMQPYIAKGIQKVPTPIISFTKKTKNWIQKRMYRQANEEEDF